jgi:tetratricopeptide (TPR) repeat protein
MPHGAAGSDRRVTRLLAAIFLFCMAHAVMAQPTLPTYPPNERPMYGLVQKNQAMLDADKQFIDTVLSMGYTREAGANKSVELGWQYFTKGDIPNAMRRFNQAWLLDPNNPAVYHGFAVALFQRDGKGAAAAAEELFRHSLSFANAWPVGYADYGRFLLRTDRPREAVPIVERGIARHASHPDGALPDLKGLYAIALFQSGRRAESCAAARAGLERSHDELFTSLETILRQPDCAG